MMKLRFALVASLLVALFAPLCLDAQVTLSGAASPASAEPGTTLVTLTGSNFPAGSILPAQVNIRLEAQAGQVGPIVTTSASGLQSVVGSTRRVTFTVPSTLIVASPTAYRASVSGTTAAGTAFSSTNFSLLTIQPVAGILSAAPSALQTGQSAAMLIRTQQGNFVQGATDANFGAGISVGVAPVGAQAAAGDAFGIAGRVIVVDPNTLLAVVRASQDAAPGTRELVLRQGPTSYRRADALAVQTGAVANTETALVNLGSPTSPDVGTPGVTTFSLAVSGLPAGTILSSQVRLFFEPALNSGSNPAITVIPSSIGAESNGQRTVSFQVPATLNFLALTDYLITLYGSTSNYGQLGSGVSFVSGNRALVRLGPPAAPAPGLSNVSPFAGLQGQSFNVSITGQNTNFVQGQTLAAFGAGISVGGAAAGQFGPVTVVSPTQATVQVQIQPGAGVGTRDIEVRTGTQAVSLRGAFEVLQGATSISLSAIQPSTARPGAVVQFTGNGFPAGNLTAANASMLLSPARPGAGPARNVPLASLSGDNAGSRQGSFVIPADFVFPQAEVYLVSVSGVAPSGVTFSSANPASLTIQPLPRLMSVAPNTGQRGQTLNLTIRGEFTAFQNGVSTVNLGAGISIGSVSVSNATTLTASVTVAANAAVGARNFVVSTGAETASLPNGFTVSSAPVSLTLSSSTSPASARAGEPVTLQAGNFPPGDVLPAQVSVLIEAVNGGGNFTAIPISIQDNGNNVRLLRFTIPSAISVTAATNYLVSLVGANTAGVSFNSGNKSALTVQPPAPSPSISSITPSQGAQGQILSVNVIGQNTSFSAVATQLSLGSGITVSALTVNSATSLTAQIVIAALAAPGARNVVVTTGAQTVSLANGFSVAPASPSISSVSPAQGSAGQTVTVSIRGQNTNFVAGVSQIAFGDGINVSNVTVQNPLSLTAQLVIAANAMAGNRTVTVLTGSEVAAGVDRFLVIAAAPTLSSINPSTGNPGQSLSVSITGQNTSFLQGTTQVSFGSGTTVSSVTFASATSLTAQLVIAADAAPGARTVTVTSGAQLVTVADGFTIGGAVPSISSISPVEGTRGQTLVLAITGRNTNFIQGSTQLSFGAGITVSNLVVQNPLSLSAQLSIAPDAAIGPRTATVQTGSQILTSSFAVVTPVPIITSLSPEVGRQGQSLALTISAQFAAFNATSTVSLGAGVTVSSVTVENPTRIVAQITIDSTAVLGERTVTVLTGSQSLSAITPFNVQTMNPVSEFSISPSAGNVMIKTRVELFGNGTAFVSGVSTPDFGPGISVQNIVVDSPTKMRAEILIQPGSSPGLRQVAVVTGATRTLAVEGFLVSGPTILITSPKRNLATNVANVDIRGQISDPSAFVSVAGVPAASSGGEFNANVSLVEGRNLIEVKTTSAGGASTLETFEVQLDTTPPRITIRTPAEGQETTASEISVSGIINDLVQGTVTDADAEVLVNGVSAAVANRTFSKSGVLLAIGENRIQIAGKDKVGNAATAEIRVRRIVPPLLAILPTSGNLQRGPGKLSLPAPIEARVTNSLGVALPGARVIFRVVRGDGGLRPVGAPTPASATLEVTADASGNARVLWTLGGRVGESNNVVEAYSTGIGAPATFTASVTQGSPTLLIVDSGMNQVSAVGETLPFPLIAAVADEAGNRLSGVRVIFSAVEGNGNFGGQPATTVTSDSSGRAAAQLRLGSVEGPDGNVVLVSLPDFPNVPLASFRATGLAPKRGVQTSIVGVVHDNANQPIPGATIRLLRLNQASVSNLPQNVAEPTQSTANGHFAMTDVPTGVFKLMVDGTTATVPGKRFPTLEFDITTVEGRANELGYTIYLPALNGSQLCVSETTGGTLTLPDAPGFSLTVAANSATFPGGSKRGCVSVTPVNLDKVPMAPGFGQQPRFVVTIQPVGTVFNPPAAISIPNVDRLAPRATTDMYSYDHDLAAFVAIGTGTVSNDGFTISSDPGIGVVKAGWHCGGNPQQNGTLATCKDCYICDGQRCQVNPANPACDDKDPCTSCSGSSLDGADCCQNGRCRGRNYSNPSGISVGWSSNGIDELIGRALRLAPCRPLPILSGGFKAEATQTCCSNPAPKKIIKAVEVSGTLTLGVRGECSTGLFVPILGVGLLYAEAKIGVQGTVTGTASGTYPEGDPSCKDCRLKAEVQAAISADGTVEAGVDAGGGPNDFNVSCKIEFTGVSLSVGVPLCPGQAKLGGSACAGPLTISCNVTLPFGFESNVNITLMDKQCEEFE
jgi:hypothetical protein